MAKKQTILQKIQKKMDKIQRIRENEDVLVEDIIELIDNEDNSFENDDI
tara:strand:- start:214 stop:360 length:147 start_codon:yes stop_codon:yes gene_type:complete